MEIIIYMCYDRRGVWCIMVCMLHFQRRVGSRMWGGMRYEVIIGLLLLLLGLPLYESCEQRGTRNRGDGSDICDKMGCKGVWGVAREKVGNMM